MEEESSWGIHDDDDDDCRIDGVEVCDTEVAASGDGDVTAVWHTELDEPESHDAMLEMGDASSASITVGIRATMSVAVGRTVTDADVGNGSPMVCTVCCDGNRLACSARNASPEVCTVCCVGNTLVCSANRSSFSELSSETRAVVAEFDTVDDVSAADDVTASLITVDAVGDVSHVEANVPDDTGVKPCRSALKLSGEP